MVDQLQLKKKFVNGFEEMVQEVVQSDKVKESLRERFGVRCLEGEGALYIYASIRRRVWIERKVDRMYIGGG